MERGDGCCGVDDWYDTSGGGANSASPVSGDASVGSVGVVSYS